MPRRRVGPGRAAVRKADLARLGEAKLAELLAEQIANLPSHRQTRWVREHLPRGSKGSTSRSRPGALLEEIEDFCAQSRSGAFVSWIPEDEWSDPGDEGDESEAFGEWVELFTDFMSRALELTRSGQHAAAVRAYALLLGLLAEAGETTDILGNHGAPEDAIALDFARVVEGYTRSLVACRGGVEGVITEILPLAKKFGYRGGFTGLARALDADGRERLKMRLTAAAEGALRTDRPDCPTEVDGLIALATVGRNRAEVLALKERFAPRNAVYLEEVLSQYERKMDWAGVARLAEVGVRTFGHHGKFATALIRAREALGDRSAAQEARVAQFLREPDAAAFAALRRQSEALSNWDAVLARLLRTATRPGEGAWHVTGLKTRILLAEGREREVFDGIAGRQGRMGFDELKLVAKYAVAKASDGADLTAFPKLRELQRRLGRDREEPYDWLRLILERPGTASRAEYARLAAAMYQRLVDLHLDSGRPSRAAPAAHYCAIVAELSRLVGEPRFWADLLRHLRQRHGRKRLIWRKLEAEGCPLS